MTEFEVLLIPISLILGLGVTRILGGFIHAVRSRRAVSMHWVPLTWAFSILLYNILYFNVLFDQYESGQPWTWLIYGSVLFQAILLFLSAGLVLQDGPSQTTGGLLGDFEADGRLALIPIAILLGTAPFTNRLQAGAPWLALNNVFNVVLTAIILAALATKTRGVRAALCISFSVLTVLGMLYVWASPGDGA